MIVFAICNTCCHKHPIDFDPKIGPGAAFSDWMQKHPAHDIDYVWPGRSQKLETNLKAWQDYLPNADIKLAYAASAAFTCDCSSLASSSTLVAGRESTAVSNTTNLYLDYLIGGKITVGTTPTTLTKIEVLVYASVNDTPTYPDVFDGTDSAETVTSAEIKRGCLKLAKVLDIVATTSDVAQWFGPQSIAALYGGQVPANFGLFVTHNTVAALHATAGNHVLSYRGAYATAI